MRPRRSDRECNERATCWWKFKRIDESEKFHSLFRGRNMIETLYPVQTKLSWLIRKEKRHFLHARIRFPLCNHPLNFFPSRYAEHRPVWRREQRYNTEGNEDEGERGLVVCLEGRTARVGFQYKSRHRNPSISMLDKQKQNKQKRRRLTVGPMVGKRRWEGWCGSVIESKYSGTNDARRRSDSSTQGYGYADHVSYEHHFD